LRGQKDIYISIYICEDWRCLLSASIRLANRPDRRLVELRRRLRELGGKANARRIVSDELGRNINRLKQQIDGLRQKIEEFI